MIVLIAGLGLIGGSMARALSKRTEYMVIGLDRCLESVRMALDEGAIDEAFVPEDLGRADALIVALRPADAVRFLTQAIPRMKKGALAFDLCGVKRAVVERIDPLAKSAGVRFVGAHPMAGREVSGFQSSDADLFQGASFIMTPVDGLPNETTDEVGALMRSAGFARMVTTTPEAHDRMIAYTSQLAHVASSAYVMSDAAISHAGYSAGSFRDMTRVARLDPDMWTELFGMNDDFLSAELGGLIDRLQAMKRALDARDHETLRELLSQGNRRKRTLIEKEGTK